MERRYVTADVFSSLAFQGNPVAVVLDADSLSSEQMQRIAAEFGYSETTFLLPPKNPENSAWVRIFSPSKEFPFAGHPNIGTAYVLAMEMYNAGSLPPKTMIFEEAAGLVRIRILFEAGKPIGAELVAPEQLSRLATVELKQIAACLSLSADEIEVATHAPQVASVGLPFIIVELKSQEALRQCVPNLTEYKLTVPVSGATSIYAYTKVSGGLHDTADVNLEARTFTNRMTEDPGTGSATAAAVALLARLYSKKTMTARVMQGVSVGRPSVINVRYTYDSAEEVRISGECVTIMQGKFSLKGDG
ncbi:PhzF family phenazine biosynthesis protein [Pseudomonas syringae]|uniref:PhzF family phenazine biosynthesis protein n=1 Tax=Pseudomonas syringae TaxID=317 RepID=A0A244ENH5_PSESX|nr:PhzF family phenazine biosynthesis protein [Pseudomonas syringae]OUM06075.1 PhzF family phenazine biosynthesis protein [Pseudomonas syringae]